MDKTRCINSKSPKVIALANKLGYSPATTAIKIENWQNENDKGLAVIPTMEDMGMKFISLSEDKELYKRFNLLNVEGKRKELTEVAAKKWAATNNGSPEYYFEVSKLNNKYFTIRIAKRLWDRRKSEITKPVQLPLFNKTDGDVLSNQIVTNILEKLKNRFKIDYQIVSDAEAQGLLSDTEEGYNNEPGFYYKNKVYIVDFGGGLDYDSAIHEYGHPFMRALNKYNPQLFSNIVADILVTKEGQKIQEEVKALKYPESQQAEEIAVRALTMLAKEDYDTKTGSLFQKAMDKLIRFLTSMLKDVFGRKDLKLSTLSPETTLRELADIFNLKQGTVVLEEVDETDKFSDIISFNKKDNSQLEIYKELISDKIVKSPDEKTYIVNGEEGYRRVSDVIRKRFNLGNLDTSVSQNLGDVFHALAANRIALAFPEFNTHFKQINVSGIEDKTVLNVNAIIDPIINRAKSEGSALIVEIPVASKKNKIAGTIDLLEITANKELKMLDYKTSLKTKTASAKYKKLKGNSEQQQQYKNILEEKLGIGMQYQELLYIKASNKNGIGFSVVEKVPVLYQTSKEKTRNEMLSNLYNQIENLLTKKNKNNAEKVESLIEAKSKLMVKLQTDVENEEILRDAFADLAAIENALSTTDVVDNDYKDYLNDLTLYKNLTKYIKVENPEQKALLSNIVGKASILFQEITDNVNKIFVKNATKDLTFEGSPVQSENDILKPIADVNSFQGKTLGASYSNDPIVIYTYKTIQTKLGEARNKARELGSKISNLTTKLKEFTGKTGEGIYDMYLQTYKGKKTGYLVREFKSEYYQDAKQAKINGDVKWFSENATFDNEKYIKAKERFENYLSMSESSSIASKLVYLKSSEKYKNMSESELSELAYNFVAEDNFKLLNEWVSKNKTIIEYNKPKLKWRDPKWVEIKEGKYKGTVVEEFYDLYTSVMEEIEDSGLPFYVSENFIPEFKKDLINKVINNGMGNLKLGESLVESLSINFDEAEINKIDPFTGKFVKSIPVLGKRKFQFGEKEEFIEKEKSYDLGYSLAVFYESAVRYQELKVLEPTIKVAEQLLKDKKEKVLNSVGEEVEEGFDLVKVSKGLENEIKRFEYFIDSTVYGKSKDEDKGFRVTGNGFTEALKLLPKGAQKIISYSKLFDNILKYTGLNNIGYNLYSPVTNLLGGKSMQFLMGVGGRWYDTKDYNFASLVVSAGPFSTISEDVVKANKFVEMLNPQINEFVKEEFDKTRSESKLIHKVPGPYSLMRWGEDHMHKAGLIAMIKSNKHSIKWDDWKLVGDKLEYVGEGEMNDAVQEMFRQKVIHVNGRALGNMNPDDKILLKKWFLGRAVMQHRGWIPAMFQSHWGKKQYDYQLQDYVEGRFMSLGRFIFKKSLKWDKLDDMEKANVKEAIAELGIIAGAITLLAALKGDDDDEERRKKLAYFIRVSDRYLAEMTFFTMVNVPDMFKILISPAPAVSSIENIGLLFNNFASTIYSSEFESEKEYEKSKKKLRKSAIRIVPLYSQGERFINEALQVQVDNEK